MKFWNVLQLLHPEFWDHQVRLAWTSICYINVGLLQWHLINIHIQEALHVRIRKDLPPMFHQVQPHQRLNKRFSGRLAHSKGNLHKAPLLINDCHLREDDACWPSESSRKSGIHQVQKDGIHQETDQWLHHKQGNHSRTVIKHPELLSTMQEANVPVSPFPSTDMLQILPQSLSILHWNCSFHSVNTFLAESPLRPSSGSDTP